MLALGIDVGTSKIAVLAMEVATGDSVWLRHTKTPDLIGCKPGEHLQDAVMVIHSIDEVLREYPYWSDTAVIGVTGQMHGIVYLNEKGVAVSSLYTWEDRRSSRQNPSSGKSYAEDVGVPVGYGHATHAYLRDHQEVPEDAVGYVTIADAVALHLCHSSSPVLHATNAASFGKFDREHSRFVGEWERECPYPIVGGYEVLGTFPAPDGKEIPVSVAIGDNQASFLGSGGGRRDVLLNIGTGAQVSMLTRERRENDARIEIRPAFEGEYLAVGSALCGGRAYAALHDFFCATVEMATGQRPHQLYDHMEQLLLGATDARIRFDNTFCGTRSDPGRRGSIRGISLDTFTPRDFCIGILEGMVNELAELYDAMGCHAERLLGSGNALRRNPLLCQMCEKRFGARLLVISGEEEAARGAAIFALLAARVSPLETIADLERYR